MTNPPRRRWLRFSLRTLFVLVTVWGVALGCLAWQMSIIYQRKSALENLPDGSYFVCYSEFGPGHAQPTLSAAARVRRFLGDDPVEFFWIPSAQYENVVGSLKVLFPEADVSEGDYRNRTVQGSSS